MKTYCLDQLVRVCELLELPDYVRETGLRYLNDGRVMKIKGCVERVALAIFLSARETRVPVSAEELTSALGINKSDLLSSLWKWNKAGDGRARFELWLSDEEWIPQVIQKLGLPPICESRARLLSASLRGSLGQQPNTKRRVILSCYLAGLEMGITPSLEGLSRQERLWLYRKVGFGRTRRAKVVGQPVAPGGEVVTTPLRITAFSSCSKFNAYLGELSSNEVQLRYPHWRFEVNL
ncbi:MAG: hypothetical protein RXR41_00830 [Candidatus Marsarchaeota archaeon]